ncbi:peptidylprolyl isomerase [Leptospira sp. GIMC2001]|uniref:peptidylprolyl isomerase n=1 Tax=Leptospira sp. GIMC2001 TaxID=1513297 RepID=UPI00234B22C0|nr:peptidylprolyl isomerase [Leptospira sp. GIMC2001]WCL47870.1 peptidylprolyl isomerase [Leptospira sp. GIMC2001]
MVKFNFIGIVSLLSLVGSLGLACKENVFAQSKYEPVAYKPVNVEVKRVDQTKLTLPEKAAIYAVFVTNKGNLILELFHKEAPKTVQNFIDLAQGEKEYYSDKGKEKKPFYDGLSFHRVIDNFMAQGGCPRGDGTGGPGYKFEDEINGKALGLDSIKIKDAPEYQSQFQRMVIQELNIQSREEFDQKRKEIEEAFQKAGELSALEVLHRVGYRYNEKLESKKAIKGSLAMANAGPNTNGSQFFINQVDTPHLNGLHTVFGQLVNGSEILDNIITSGNGNTIIQKVLILDRRENPTQ